MEYFGIIFFVIAVILGVRVVNFAYKIYMNIMDIDSMYYNPRKKLIYIIIVSGAIWMFFLKIFMGM